MSYSVSKSLNNGFKIRLSLPKEGQTHRVTISEDRTHGHCHKRREVSDAPSQMPRTLFLTPAG